MLLLFDIDGTLLAGATEHHAQAIRRACGEVHGIAEPHHDVPAAGRTDWAIARSLLLASGIPDGQVVERMDAVLARAAEVYEPPSLAAHVIPGAPDLVRAAARDHTVGLVTGNVREIARRKLTAAGIFAPFDGAPGAFGDDHEERDSLPAIARRRAGDVPASETVVIGDTPRDIACARADGCRVVAVTTGPYGAGDLQGADAVVGGPGEVLPALAALG